MRGDQTIDVDFDLESSDGVSVLLDRSLLTFSRLANSMRTIHSLLVHRRVELVVVNYRKYRQQARSFREFPYNSHSQITVSAPVRLIPKVSTSTCAHKLLLKLT
jgi:hypothetical protein